MGGGMDGDRIETLIGIMDNDDDAIKQRAGRKLAGIGEPAIPALIEALKNGKPRLRESACIVLALMGEKAAPAVGELMRSDDPEIKLSAMLTLAMIRSEVEGSKETREEPEHRIHAISETKGGETVDAPRLVKRPVQRQEDATLRLRPQKRLG